METPAQFRISNVECRMSMMGDLSSGAINALGTVAVKKRGHAVHTEETMPNNRNNDQEQEGKRDDRDEIGEGNRDADRRYRTATEDYVKSGRPDAAGKEARRALDDESERRELEAAERRARQSGQTSPGRAPHHAPDRDQGGNQKNAHGNDGSHGANDRKR
jgi:hypothetical protein